jgi:hypothetical protein
VPAAALAPAAARPPPAPDEAGEMHDEAPAADLGGLGLRSMATRANVLSMTLQTGPRADGETGYQVRLRVKG